LHQVKDPASVFVVVVVVVVANLGARVRVRGFRVLGLGVLGFRVRDSSRGFRARVRVRV
jgi:hypothetical protein